jgi:hypothetical protein
MNTEFRKPCYSRDAYSVSKSGLRWNQFCFRRGIASEFIHHLPALLAKTKNRRVVLYVRASSAWQKENGNLDEAEQEALQQLKALKTLPERCLLRKVKLLLYPLPNALREFIGCSFFGVVWSNPHLPLNGFRHFANFLGSVSP